MRYVQRDAEGKVIAHFANAQEYATEALPDDHADIEAFRAWRRVLAKPSAALHVAGTLRRSPFARGLIKVLARRLKLSEAKLLADVVAAAEEEQPRSGTDSDTD
jgi:hypothetical protein